MSTSTAPQYATFYDPNAESERPVPLPSAPIVPLSLPGLSLQPPLSRRGTGPGLVVFLPPASALSPHEKQGLPRPLDPDPVLKWSEEGYAVVAITEVEGEENVKKAIEVAVDTLEKCETVDIKDKFGVLVYNPELMPIIETLIPAFPKLIALISHGIAPTASFTHIPTMVHLPTPPTPHTPFVPTTTGETHPSPHVLKIHHYPTPKTHFIVPSAGPGVYLSSSASVAHTRSLVFLREHVGGPFFDLEVIWDEHTFFEFVDRSVAKTMGTMVAEPYVNHVPTLTGGMGRKNLSEFYRDHFIFNNPSSVELVVVSRTVGPDRVVDEFVYKCIHDCVIDWLLPGVPATNRQLEIPMMAVVNVRGDRLYHEHIWWDQATALQQAGYLPKYVPIGEPTEGKKLRLPTDGYNSAKMLLDETDGQSNDMFGSDWGVQDASAQ